MPFGPFTLARIKTLQPSLQPITTRFLELAQEQGIPCDVVQGYRTPAEQQSLYDDKTKKVTFAPALLSFHNYGLAFDVVPVVYLTLPNWNPGGDLWQKLGAIGETLGLSWGGRWLTPDRPHFELPGTPIADLKAYWEKFKTIMPVTVGPTTTTILILVLAGFAWWMWLRPTMHRAGMV